MLYYSREAVDKINGVGRLAKRGKGNPLEGARQILALEPAFGPAILLVGEALREAGELTQAEEMLWNGLAKCPCNALLYYSLAGVIRALRPDDPCVQELVRFTCRKISLAETVNPAAAQAMESLVMDTGAPDDPHTYGDLAEALSSGWKAKPADERLASYRTLDDLQFDASLELNPETLRELLEHPATYTPLLYGAVREWANTDHETFSLQPPALGFFLAILGEIGAAERIADLLELSQNGDEATFLHVHWAIFRLGQRFPDAALEAFRTTTKGASAGMRCGLAEQLNLLPPLEGVRPALAGLLDGFERLAKDQNAAYLLAIVTDAMAERDAVEDAQALLARYQGLLVKDARKWLQESIDGDEEFIPQLVEEGIPGYTIQDVCLGRVFVQDEHDEDEFEDELEAGEFGDEFEDAAFEDAEDEFELNEPFTPRVGRNDPCWCGSGKKYKKCHLRQDEDAHLAKAPPASPAEVPLPLRILRSMSRWHKPQDEARARKMFFGTTEDKPRHESEVDAYFQFLLHDFRDAATGRTLIEHFLDENGSRLSPGERAQAEAMRDSRVGLYETFRVEKGRGVHLRDIFDGATFFVEDITSSHHSVRDDCGLLRVQLQEGHYVLSGNGMSVARDLLGAMRTFVKVASQAAGQDEAEFVRANSQLVRHYYLELHSRRFANLKVIDRDGDELEFCAAEYEVLDRPALLKSMASLAELEETEAAGSVANFVWREPGDGPRPVHGAIKLSSTRLRLETASRKYRELGRGMLEYNAGRFLKYLGGESTTIDDVKRHALSGNQPPSAPPSAEDRAGILEYKTHYYSTWPDTPLPALKGKTPRKAIKTPAGREDLLQLLRDMENREAHAAKDGEAPYVFGILRRELGLEDE